MARQVSQSTKKDVPNSLVVGGSLTVLGGINNPDFAKTITRLATTQEDVRQVQVEISEVIESVPIIAPTNNVSNVRLSYIQNADGSIDITLLADYTQGTNRADGIFLYVKQDYDTPGAFDYDSDKNLWIRINQIEDSLTDISHTFALPARSGGGSGAVIHYKIGAVAAAGNKLHTSGAVVPTSPDDWNDIVFDPVIQDIDFNLYDKSFTSYEGSGVFRRAVRVSGDGVRWLNAPDGGSEEEKARIKRLGKGSEYVLMDGRFSSNDDNCFWKFGEVVASSLSSYPSVDIAWISPTEIRYVYSTGSVYEKVYNGSTWGAASLIASNAINPGYGFDIDGNLVLGFSNTSTNDLVVYKRSGGSWSPHSTVYNGSSGNSSRPRFCIYDNILYIAYYNGVEGGAIEKYYSGGAWSSASVISASHGVDGYIVNLDGDRQIFYSQASTNYFASKTYNGSSWGSEATEISTAMTGACDVIKTIDNKIRVAFCRSSDSAIVESSYDGSSWSTPTTIGASSEWSALSQSDDGTLYLAYVNLADRYGHFGYLKRYAPVASYATGTWTPRVYGTTAAGVGTYSNQYGCYYLIGKVCFIQFYLSLTAHTGTGNIRIDGLPFTSSNNPGSYFPITIYGSSYALTSGRIMTSYINQNSKHMVPRELDSNGTHAEIPIDTSCSITAAGFYFID